MSRLTCKYDGINALREMCTFDRESDIEADDCLNCEEYCDTMDALGGDCDNCAIQKAFDKLAEYEDLEEQGLLLKLPCKIGDTVYSITRDFISEYKICSFEKYLEGFFFNWGCEKGIYSNIRGFTHFEIGKTVFLTKEEAEKALKEMKEGSD